MKYTIVVGVNFDQSSDDALVNALLALQTGTVGVVHVMHVIAPCELRCSVDCKCARLETEVLALAPSALQERVAYFAKMLDIPYRADQIVTHARVGDPVECLLQTCTDYGADLLIVGVFGSAVPPRTSMSESLVGRAHCPVFVMRPRGHEGPAHSLVPALASYPAARSSRRPSSPADARVLVLD